MGGTSKLPPCQPTTFHVSKITQLLEVTLRNLQGFELKWTGDVKVNMQKEASFPEHQQRCHTSKHKLKQQIYDGHFLF